MSERIERFGGDTQGHIQYEGQPSTNLPFERELWFDRDIDGRWLVCVADSGDAGPERLGAIVVKDASIGRFIDMLGQLVADPGAFADEPVVLEPRWNGHHFN